MTYWECTKCDYCGRIVDHRTAIHLHRNPFDGSESRSLSCGSCNEVLEEISPVAIAIVGMARDSIGGMARDLYLQIETQCLKVCREKAGMSICVGGESPYA